MASTNDAYLFVYGTLKKGRRNPIKHLFELKTEYIEESSIIGELYLVDYYPGLTRTSENNTVHGELYRIKDLSILTRLDEYEGCHTQSPKPHIYQRIIVPIKSSLGNIKAWTYEYIASTKGLLKIDKGRF